MRSTLVSVSLLVLCSFPGMAATPKPAVLSPAHHLPVPQDVAPQARRALKARMGQHATSMQNLVHAVVLVDRPTIRVLADRIAGEQTFVFSATLDLAIPSQVISEGEKLVAAAVELAFVAATGTDDGVLTDRFAVPMRTCVSCHSGYLRGPRMRNPVDYEPSDREPQLESPRPAAR